MSNDGTADDKARAGVPLEVVRAERVRLQAELANALAAEGVARLAAGLDGPGATYDAASGAFVPATWATAAPARVRLDLRPVGEVYGSSWLDNPPPTRQSLLTRDGKPFLVQGKVGLLLAPGGTGKTYALAQLAVAVATGGKWLGTYQAEKGRVLFALGEEDAEELHRRIHYTAKDLGLDEYERAELARNLTVLGLSGRSLAMLGRNANGEPEASAWFHEWRASLAAAGPWRCLLLDPWSRWGGHDVEKDNSAATRGVELLEELTQLEGSPTVVVAHHTRKPKDGEKGGDADSSRGASALVDGARWACNLIRHNDMDEDVALLRLRVTKTNYTGPSPELHLTRDKSSGVLRPLTPAEVADSTKADKKPKAEGATSEKTTSETTTSKRATGEPVGGRKV